MITISTEKKLEIFGQLTLPKKEKVEAAPAHHVKKFHDKLQDKLDKLANRFKVKISLARNKRKMPSITITGLKGMKHEQAVRLFKAISNSSPIPQKMDGNRAVFTVFGPRRSKSRVTANDDKTSNDSDGKKFLVQEIKRGRGGKWYTVRSFDRQEEADKFRKWMGITNTRIKEISASSLTANDKVASVYQDGADFYMKTNGKKETLTAPFKVKDHDINAAKKAREWFMQECSKRGITPKWDDDSDD
jgi:hypothetical protein